MRWLVGAAVLLGGCGTTHPLDRPVVVNCETAFLSGQQGDPCTFAGECAISMDLGARRGAALCSNGLLRIVRIEEREESGAAPCLGERHEESDADVSFSPSGIGCIEVTFCNEIPGGATALRIAQVCQVGPRTEPPVGTPLRRSAAAVADSRS